MREDTVDCPQCRQTNAVSAKYCNNCGAHIEPLAVPETISVGAGGSSGDVPPESPMQAIFGPSWNPDEATAPTSPDSPAASQQPDANATPQDADPAMESAAESPHGRRRQWILAGAAVATLVAAGVIAFALLVGFGPSQDQLAVLSAHSQSQQLLDEAAAASSTADLRDVAALAEQAQAASTQAWEAAEPGSVEAALLAGYSDLAAGLTAMSAIDGDNLALWRDARQQINTGAEQINAAAAGGLLIDGQDPTISVDAATGHVNEVVAEGRQTLADWAKHDTRVQQNNADVTAERTELQSYRAEGDSILDSYINLRNDTADFSDEIRSGGVSYGMAFDYFGGGESDRRDLANRMQALNYPDGVAAEHAHMVAVITAGAVAMNAAYDGVDETYECNDNPWGYDFCDYRDSSGWQRFQSESDRITGEFDTARSQWTSTIDDRLDSLTLQERPVKPVV